MIRFVLELPVALVALIVKVAVANTAVGVPDMIPVVGSIDKPAGNEPPAVIVQFDDAPPVFVGVAAVIAVPTE